MGPARMQVELPSHPGVTRPAALAARMPKPAAFPGKHRVGQTPPPAPGTRHCPQVWWHPTRERAAAVLRLLCGKRQACLEISASPLQLSALHCLGPQAKLSPRHAWQKHEGSQVFWPSELIFSFLAVLSMFSIVSILQFGLRKLYKQLSSAPGSKRYMRFKGIFHSISFKTKYLFLFVWKKEWVSLVPFQGTSMWG